MCPPFLTQARQPGHRFSVGLKGCRQQHLSPKPFIRKKQQLECYYKNRLFLTVDVPGMTSQMKQMYTSSYDIRNKRVATIEI